MNPRDSCLVLFFSVFGGDEVMDRESSRELMQEKVNMCKTLENEFHMHPNTYSYDMLDLFLHNSFSYNFEIGGLPKLPTQGITLHVTADDSKDYLNLLDRLVPLLDRYNMAYDVVNPMMCETWLQKDIGTNSGKMITIYPTDNTNIDFFSNPDVKKILSEETKMNIENEKSLGGRLFGRFGGVTSGTIQDPITGEVYKDYGTQKFPVFVEDISLNDFIKQCIIGKEEGIEGMNKFVPEHYIYIEKSDRLEKDETETDSEKKYENVISDSYDYDNIGDMIREVVCETFNKEGNLMQETHILQHGIEIERETIEYDKDGKEISVINVSCAAHDRFYSRVTSVTCIEMEYDKNGGLTNMKMEIEKTDDPFGKWEIRGIKLPIKNGFAEISYDEKGNSKEHYLECDTFYGRVDEHIFEKEFDKDGNLHILRTGNVISESIVNYNLENGNKTEESVVYNLEGLSKMDPRVINVYTLYDISDFPNHTSINKIEERVVYNPDNGNKLENSRVYNFENGNKLKTEEKIENDGRKICSRVEYDKNGDVISTSEFTIWYNDTDNSDKDDSAIDDKDEWNDNYDDFESEYDPVE